MSNEETSAVPVSRDPVATTGTTYPAASYQSAPPVSTATRRISWGGIFAGTVMALVSQLAFSLLALGLGAWAVNPYDNNPANGLGIGAAIYTLVTVLISLFTGGYVAGRLAGIPRKQDSVLHGFVTFGLTTLLGFYLLTSGIGKIIGGAGSLVSSVLSTAGSAVSSVAPDLESAAKNKLQQNGVDLSDLQGQVDTLLQQTGKPALQPGNLQDRAQAAGDQAQNAAGTAAANPNDANVDLKSMVTNIFNKNKDVLDAADRTALVNVIMARTGKARPEAEQIVDNYQKTYTQARQKADQLADEAKQKALAAANATRKDAAKAGLAASLALLLGSLAAALGGGIATPRD